jgi:NADP-dependent 3-hydroxy acid dehydrogenase YdfG
MSQLAGKVALVIGASRGIGAAAAQAMADAGATVVLAARDVRALDKVAEAIRSTGVQSLAIPTDISDERQVSALSTGQLPRSAGSMRPSTTPGGDISPRPWPNSRSWISMRPFVSTSAAS